MICISSRQNHRFFSFTVMQAEHSGFGLRWLRTTLRFKKLRLGTWRQIASQIWVAS
jgi:hypothetical protein